jgi:lysophospholipase L1-like esterase
MKNLVLSIAIVVVLAAPPSKSAAQQTQWTGSWAAAPAAASTAAAIPGPRGATIRDVVHLSIGGKALRLRLSNEFGAAPLTLASVHVALSAGEDAIQPHTDRVATFGGVDSVTLPAGAAILSDPVALPVQPFANLAVSLFIPAQSGVAITYHALASSTNYIEAGDEAPAATLPAATPMAHWYLLTGVEVDAGPSASSVVVLGASICDGFNSTPNKNVRWPDDLAARLQARPATAHIGVLNEGISGNRLLHDGTGPSALARFDRDVLAQSGATYLIVLIGTNDIGHTFADQAPNEPVTAKEMVWGYQQLVARAHARNIKVYGALLTPDGKSKYDVPGNETLRQQVNALIKAGDVFDAVIDFDKPVRDPAHPDALLPAFDSGDHLHPNDAGYQAMANAIDLKLFTK